MKSKKKVLVTLLCAALLVFASVMGTMAYLTSQDSVTNTFTVGNVAITLDEADVKTDGTYETDATARVDANKYHLIPGHSYIKDPTVHVADTSEDCWVFVRVEDGLAAIEDAKTIATQMSEKGWVLVEGTTNVFAKATISQAGDDLIVFDNFKLKGDADVSKYANAQIVVTAYAVQADGFSTSKAAWDAAQYDLGLAE